MTDSTLRLQGTGDVPGVARGIVRRAVEVLIPYLGRLPELTYWARLVRDALPIGVPVGAMLQTPAAVLDIGSWLAMTDVIAIGCNDLMPCLFGADRDEPRVCDSLDPCAPVPYRLLGNPATDVAEHRASVRLCGVLPRPGSVRAGIGRCRGAGEAW